MGEDTHSPFSPFYACARDSEASLLNAVLAVRENYLHTLSLEGAERLHVSVKEIAAEAELSRGILERLAAAIQQTAAFAMVDCQVQASILRMFQV